MTQIRNIARASVNYGYVPKKEMTHPIPFLTECVISRLLQIRNIPSSLSPGNRHFSFRLAGKITDRMLREFSDLSVSQEVPHILSAIHPASRTPLCVFELHTSRGRARFENSPVKVCARGTHRSSRRERLTPVLSHHRAYGSRTRRFQ